MSDQTLSELIDATEQERQRIEQPKNRSRYFMFGKRDEHYTRQTYSVTFENVPDRVLRDARWSAGRGIVSLFKIGDIFVPGTMQETRVGVEVSFRTDELAGLKIDIADLKQSTDNGIDYVMDNRELTNHLLAFLESKRQLENRFLHALIQKSTPIPIKRASRPIDYPGLNPSQKAAIEKALGHQVTFFWGPPGTGKTKTMGALAASLIQNHKRVLLTALSNMALDQLLLTTSGLLQDTSLQTSIARQGSTMDEKCRGFSRSAFDRSAFSARRAGMTWGEHVVNASLVAANFAMLAFPRATNPGQFDYVIADEVSMANIPSLAAASFFATTGMVVGGDPKQLPPIYPEDAEEPNEWFSKDIFQKARVTRDDPRVAFLDTQYRMQREINDLVSEMFYDGHLRTGTEDVSPVAGFGQRVVFINSPGEVGIVGGSESDEEQRRFNDVHAQSAARAVFWLLRNGYRPCDIGVIAPYNAQVVNIFQTIRQMSRYEGLNTDGTKVSTVHSFQGQERRVIVADFTDDNVKPTRLTAKRELINVAISRAKDQLILIGNADYLLNDKYFRREEIQLFKTMLGRATMYVWRS